MSFLIKNWKFALAILIAGLVLWQILSGWAMARKYFNIAIDQIRQDETQIEKDKDKWIEECEKEILQLAADKEELRKRELAAEKRELASKKVSAEALEKAARLEGENSELRKKLENIVVSSDPDKLLEDLRSRGINIRRLEAR